MIIRKYEKKDICQIAQMFYDTVHQVNCKDYTEEQLEAWAPEKMDLEGWNDTLIRNYSIVAIEKESLLGFGDIDETGYLDRLYVHKDYQGQGIAAAICNELEDQITGTITVHASITARGFFQHRGYMIVSQQVVMKDNVSLKNYVMVKKGEERQAAFILTSVDMNGNMKP